MEFPTIDKFAKDVAEKVLDEFIYEGKTIREWVEIIAKQDPSEDWHDVPSDEMTLEQARQAVEDLRKKLVEYLRQEPCEYKPFIIDKPKDEDMLKLLRTFQNQKVLVAEHDCLPSVTPQAEQKAILDKITAEIWEEAEWAYSDFDEYKEIVLETEPDELPDDEFRFGLHRAVEIINKYKAESEDNKDGKV